MVDDGLTSLGDAPAPVVDDRLPWEERGRWGFLPAFFKTVWLFVNAPGTAYRRTRERGDLASPLAFAIIVFLIGFLIEMSLRLLFSSSLLFLFPDGMLDEFGLGVAEIIGESMIAFPFGLLLGPVAVVIGIFISSAILHLFLIMVGALGDSRAGFEGTLRVYSYAQVANLIVLVPLLGFVFAIVWEVILLVIGLAVIHRTTQRKALLAVLLPMIICCSCLMLVFMGVMGAIMAAVYSGAV